MRKRKRKHFFVYQPTINDARYHEVNEVGWEGVEWANEYIGLTSFPKEEGIEDLIRAGIDAGLYSHNWTVSARNVDETFPITNMMGDASDIVFMGPNRKSGSVGDVVIEPHSGMAWFCMSVGWIKLSDELRKYLEHKVTTTLPELSDV